MNEFVDNSVRDAVMTTLLQQPENKQCFDCKSKNPKWSSSNIGIFLCYQCTSKHRSMGTHISFVRSLKMDRWKRTELMKMVQGGNKSAQLFYEENGMFKDGKPDHEASSHSRQKMELTAKAEAAVREEIQAQAATQPVAAQAASMMPAANLNGPIQGLNNNLFEGMEAPAMQNNTNVNTILNEPAPQATFQAISVPVNSSAPAAQAKGSMQLGKKTNNLSAASAQPIGGISFARKQENGQVKSLNAKKLDIDFGGDDFFNTFQPAAAQEAEQPLFGVLGGNNAAQKKSTTNKLQEVDSDPFKLGVASSSTQPLNPIGSYNNAPDDGLSNQAAEERLRQLGNRKAISSADFQNNDAHNEQMQSRFQQLTGATQISSDMMFGQPGGQQAAASTTSASSTFNTEQMASNAQHLANNATDFFSSIYSKLSQAGTNTGTGPYNQ